jgi:hypothetical protein
MSVDENLLSEARAAIADLARRIREKPDAELVLLFAQLERPTAALRDELVEKATKRKPRPARKPKRAARAVTSPVAAASAKPEGEVAKSGSRPTRAAATQDLSGSPLQARVLDHLVKTGPQTAASVATALKLERRLAGMTLQRLSEKQLAGLVPGKFRNREWIAA